MEEQDIEQDPQQESRIDMDVAEKYKSEYVAYDTEANVMVTAYDVMFGDNKGHEVIKLPEAVGKIRENLDSSIKKGNLRTDNTEGVLIDIRQALNN